MKNPEFNSILADALEKDKQLQKEEAIMEAACDYCHWPHVYENEDLYEEKCDSCEVASRVRTALGLE